MQAIQKLEMRNMSRLFGATAAINNFNLVVNGGMFVSLLGPSGCGKSTALNCIAGLLDLSAGQILLNDQPIQNVPAEKRSFGMVFQNYALFPHMTVKRNVSYGLETRPMSAAEREKRVRWALDLVQLDADELGHRFPAQLSGGQQQRLALARTIVLEPRLLLLDEPLSNLDTKLRNEMRIEIKRMHRELGLTTIYVTHDQSEAMSLSDLVVVMRKGQIEQIGTPPQIYNCPNSLYVADFMGYANRFAVTLKRRESTEFVVQTDGGLTIRGTSVALDAANWLPGQRLLACSRPDEMTTSAADNRIQGTVRLVEYIGKDFEAVIWLASDESIQLLIQSPDLLEMGHPVSFGIRPDRLLLFPYEDGALSASRHSPSATIKEARHA